MSTSMSTKGVEVLYCERLIYSLGIDDKCNQATHCLVTWNDSSINKIVNAVRITKSYRPRSCILFFMITRYTHAVTACVPILMSRITHNICLQANSY